MQLTSWLWRPCRYVDEALRDLTGYPTQMLRLPHTLLPHVARRLLAAQYAGTKVLSNKPWTVAEDVMARQALSVRLGYVLSWVERGCTQCAVQRVPALGVPVTRMRWW